VGQKSADEGLATRCDSCVVETDGHDPTDINRLLDAVRKLIGLGAMLCGRFHLSDWRQSRSLIRQLKTLYRTAQRIRASSSKDEGKKQARKNEINKIYTEHLDFAQTVVARATLTRWHLERIHGLLPGELRQRDE